MADKKPSNGRARVTIEVNADEMKVLEEAAWNSQNREFAREMLRAGTALERNLTRAYTEQKDAALDVKV